MTAEEELKAHENELTWLLEEIHIEIKSSVIIGLKECIGQLCDKDNGVKLVMSSSRRETVKGTVDRVGTNISDCDMLVKLPSINEGHSFGIKLVKNEGDNDVGDNNTDGLSTHPSADPYPLIQLVDTINFLNEALQMSEGLTAQCKEKRNSGDINGNSNSPTSNSSTTTSLPHCHTNVQTQLGLSQMLALIKNALTSLHEPKASSIYPQRKTDQNKFINLPAGVAVDFYLIDSNVITDIRTFENIDDPSNHNNALDTITSMLSLGKKKQPVNIVEYDEKSVIEHERVRIESLDPNLISVSSKLTALEALLECMVRKLQLCLST